jgi:ENTH domain
MEEFGITPTISSGVFSLVQEATKNDNSDCPMSTFHSIADDTIAHAEDIPTIISIIWSNLKSPAKDWRKINKTLGLAIVLAKFGNLRVIEDLKKQINLFKDLMEFFFIEARLDKGGIVRDKARILYFMLNTPGFIETERESLRKPLDRNNPPTSWHSEPLYERKDPVIKKYEQPRNEETLNRIFEQPQKKNEDSKPAKINVFQGINVKSSPSIFNGSKPSIEKDLLIDFSSQESIQKTNLKSNNLPQDLLFLQEDLTTKPFIEKDLLDVSIPSLPLAIPEKKTEIIEKKPEPKVSYNISTEGMSMNLIKAIPSINKPPASQPLPPPKDLETRLLNLDDLTNSLSEVVPKPPQRSYY